MFKLVSFVAVALVLSAAGPEKVRQDEAAREVIDLAVRAAGGEQRLARTKVMTRLARGTSFFFGREIMFTTQLTVAFPDRFRDRIELDAAGGKTLITRVVDRDRGWQSAGGATTEIPRAELDDLKEEVYALWLTTLVPLRSPEFALTALPEARVNDRPVVPVQVSRAGHADVTIYFERRTYWPFKMSRRGREAGLMVNKEYSFAEPREWAGVRVPMKQTEMVNGNKSVELVVTSYEFLDRAPDVLFAKP